MLRDIRDQMPRTPQTDPNKFPTYQYQPYPRMLKDEDGKPYKHKNGQYVIVDSAVEEAAFFGSKEQPTQAKAVEISADDGGAVLADIAPQSEGSEAVVRRGPGRPPKLPVDLK